MDLLIQYNFSHSTELLMDVWVANLESKTRVQISPEKALELRDKIKKTKYLDSFIDQHHHFHPLIVSTYGVMGYEAPTHIHSLVANLSHKWKEPYPHMCDYLKARLLVYIYIWVTHCYINRLWVPWMNIKFRLSLLEYIVGLIIFIQ